MYNINLVWYQKKIRCIIIKSKNIEAEIWFALNQFNINEETVLIDLNDFLKDV